MHAYIVRTAVLNIDWKLGMKTNATTETNTTVVFKWSGYHNVYMFPSKAAFDSCDFSDATELATNDKNPFTYKASAPGTYYFGCEVGNGYHCKQPQKLALTVTGALCIWVSS